MAVWWFKGLKKFLSGLMVSDFYWYIGGIKSSYDLVRFKKNVCSSYYLDLSCATFW